MARYRKESHTFSILLGIVGVAILICAAIYVVVTEDAPKVERATFCPVDRKLIPLHSVVILDRTEPLNAVQKEAVRVELRKVLEKSEPFERISLYEILGRKSVEAKPIVILCNPIRPKKGSEFSQKFETDELLALKKFQQVFLERFMAKVDERLDVVAQQDSPILEMLQAVNVHDLKAVPAGAGKRIMIFSDMMQHSPDYSHYKEKPTAAFFKSTFYKRVATDLSGTDVHVYYINRAGGVSQQPDGHKEFWQSYFSQVGASGTGFVPIEGAGWVDTTKSK